MKRNSYLVLALGLFLVMSCKNNSKDTDSPETVTINTKAKEIHKAAPTTVEFSSEEVAIAYSGYNAIKTALVNTNFSEAKSKAETSLDTLRKTELKSGYIDALALLAVEDNIDGQREAFEAVTQEMTNLVEGNIATGKLYYQYCPMAFNNKGAYWLSNEEAIRNPYFGDKMLKCGLVERDIE